MNRYYVLLFLGLWSIAAKGQIMHDSIRVAGQYRSFHFLKPAGPNPTLVFVLHGSGGGGLQIRTSPANVENIDENAFFGAMLAYFDRNYRHNPKRVFAVGTSGGGHMAYKLALTMPERFRAITAIIANLPDTANLDCPEKRVAMPVLIINGTADSVNPYEGGEVNLGPAVKMGTVRSTDRTFGYWASLAGYSNTPTKTTLPDTDPNDGKTVEQYTFSQPGQPEVTLLKVLGGRHDYPNDINVYLTAWAFFKRQQ